MRRTARAAAVTMAATALAIVALPALASPPARVVSLHLCTDQLLLALAERSSIASVSFIAADPQASPVAAAARGLPVNHARAEEVVQLRPDLVLASVYTDRTTVTLLRRLGVSVEVVPDATDLAGIRAAIRQVASVLDRETRGEAVIAAFDRTLDTVGPLDKDTRPLAVLLWSNGLTSGSGTLADAVLRRAGFRNLAAERGIAGMARLSLETLLVSQPALIVIGAPRRGAALADAIFHHPALRAAKRRAPAVAAAEERWSCGAPQIADVVAELAQLRPGR